jgi:hypothetical protein
VQTRQRLASVPTVTRVEMRSLSRTMAEMDLVFTGDAERLRSALAQRELALGTAPLPPEQGSPAGIGMPAPSSEIWPLRWNGSSAP